MVERCDFKVGERIDSYIVECKLGTGSFGDVYKVKGKSSEDIYALKVLKLWEVPSDIRQQLEARFEMEFQTGQINSPYLVKSLAKGFVNGNPYILMEFCPYGDLSSFKNADTDWNVIAHQVLYGLKALHQSGKVHRDLKPENVLIKSDKTAALTDFGICGDRNKRLTERNVLGKPQQMFGTYAYMPPEQVERKRGDATVLPTTDIFSFGVMMYQLLTGKLPFGELSTENDLVKYIRRGKNGDWDRSSLMYSKHGADFKNAIEGCLEPDFTKRLQSVDEVLRFLPSVAINVPQVDNFSSDSFKFSHYKGVFLRIMQGEEYGKEINLSALAQHHNVITVGRADESVNNVLPIVENQTSYISRKHCTLELDNQSNVWFIRDGQWDVNTFGRWKSSTNGTFVNSKQVSQNGYFLADGDIISIGDTKLRLEIYK